MGRLILIVNFLALTFIISFIKLDCRKSSTRLPCYFGGQCKEKLIFARISTFNTWLWTTSILGACEAGIIYGFLGCFSYAIGASMGFFFTLQVMYSGRRKYGKVFFVSDSIREKFSGQGEIVTIVMLVMMAAYTIVQQLVGMANVFSVVWGLSYKIIAIMMISIIGVFVMLTGEKGVVIADILYFPIIISGIIVMAGLFIAGSEANIFQEGIKLVVEDFYNSIAGFQVRAFLFGVGYYIIVMTIMGATQTLLDPTYYRIANMIEDPRNAVKAIRDGGIILWTPVVIIISTIMCCIWRAKMGTQMLSGSNTNELVQVLFVESNSTLLKIVFSLVIVAIVIVTSTNTLMGVFSILTQRAYALIVDDKNVKEEESMRFGRIFLPMFFVFCGLVTLSLDNLSLFLINIACGIFFAAPCGVILLGKNYQTTNIKIYYGAILSGIATGITAWFISPLGSGSVLLGTTISFILPAVIIGFIDFIQKYAEV